MSEEQLPYHHNPDYVQPLEESWINDIADPAPKHTPIAPPLISPEEKKSKQAELYKICQDEVLRRLADTPDKLGRSQMWKVNAIKEDIANKRTDTGVMDWLAKEVIAMMEKYF